MQGVLCKRVFRDLKSNFFRYFSLLLLIVLSMYLVVSIVGSAEMVMQGVEQGLEEQAVEDGQFGVFVPLTEAELAGLEQAGVTVEAEFYMDYYVGESTLRVMQERVNINRFAATLGEVKPEDGTLLLEQRYAQEHGISIGDQVQIGSLSFTVAGIGSTPDYDAVLEAMSDSSVDSSQFGTAFVTAGDYEKLKSLQESYKTEEYVYSYRLNGAMTQDELKEMLQDFTLDRSKVQDVYFLEMVEEIEQDKTDIQEGIDELVDGVQELNDGLWEIAEHNSELNDAADTIFEAMLEQINDSLQDAGIDVVLTESGYERQLDQLLANTGAYTKETRENLREARESMMGVRDFVIGVKEYTDAVGTAAGGTGQLSDGFAQMQPVVNGAGAMLGTDAYAKAYEQLLTGLDGLGKGLDTLTEHNSDLVIAANDIYVALIDIVAEQVKDSGLDVEITPSNYEEELAKLIAENGAIDEKLRENLRDIKESLADLKDFKEGVGDYTDGVTEAAEGCDELLDGVWELKEEADDLLEEYFTLDLDNLTSFVPSEDNPRIGASADDVIINKYAGIAAGVIIMILFTYVISVFVVHTIEQESSVIGALYALGVNRRQLMVHYLLLPVMVTLIGSVLGSVLGFSPLGVDVQAQDSLLYFSLPPIHTVYPMYLIVYSLIMPPVIAVIVNYLVINKKLKRTALSLMRNEKKRGKAHHDIALGNLPFIRRFQIRQILREGRSSAAVIGGMFISLLVLMLAINCYELCANYALAAKAETKFSYLYSYKYPTEEVPEGGTAFYMESLKKEVLGYNLEVSVIGMETDNPYFEAPVTKKQNEIVVSEAVATKFDVKKGEKLVLSDEVNDRDYAFTVVDIVPFNSALYAFMDIETMRELFGQEEDYYNAVCSMEALDIDSGRLYATISRESVEKASSVFTEFMWPMVVTMSIVAVIIFVVVMYLMLKVMIDRAAFPISVMKIFGYRKREIKRLYLDGSFFTVVLGAVICVPLSKWAMDAMYPMLVYNVAIGLDLAFSAQMYAGIYAGILICYFVISQLLVRRLEKITPAEVLKNRE